MKKRRGKGKQLLENEKSLRAKEYLDYLDQKETDYKLEKKSRETIIVSSEDQKNLGLLSSGWHNFKTNLLKTYFVETQKQMKLLIIGI